jgi:hypothetical protein
MALGRKVDGGSNVKLYVYLPVQATSVPILKCPGTKIEEYNDGYIRLRLQGSLKMKIEKFS